MRTRSEIEHMAQVAQRASGWDPADMTKRLPVEPLDRAFAEGVELALRWALGEAGAPFPRGR